jgi:hypothetical protein
VNQSSPVKKSTRQELSANGKKNTVKKTASRGIQAGLSNAKTNNLLPAVKKQADGPSQVGT